MGLLDSIDVVPSQMERILYMIKTQKICIPSILFMDMKRMILKKNGKF